MAVIKGVKRVYLRFGILLLQVIILVSCEEIPKMNFTPPLRNRPIANLAYDSATGNVYIGGKNAVFRMDLSLQLIETAITGPVNDTLDGENKRKKSQQS